LKSIDKIGDDKGQLYDQVQDHMQLLSQLFSSEEKKIVAILHSNGADISLPNSKSDIITLKSIIRWQ